MVTLKCFYHGWEKRAIRVRQEQCRHKRIVKRIISRQFDISHFCRDFTDLFSQVMIYQTQVSPFNGGVSQEVKILPRHIQLQLRSAQPGFFQNLQVLLFEDYLL